MAAAGLGGTPAVAPARSILRPPDAEDLSTWAVAGDGIDFVKRGSHLRVFREGSAGRYRPLKRFDGLSAVKPHRRADLHHKQVSIATSRRLVGVSVSNQDEYAEGAGGFTEFDTSALEVSRLGGPARRLASCRAGRIGPVSVDGDVVAYVGSNCRADNTSIGVRDLAPGAASATVALRPPAGRAFVALKLSGRYVAAVAARFDVGEGDYGSPTGIFVFDRITGRRLFRADPADYFDLRPDGTLVTEQITSSEDDPCGVSELRLTSASEPAGRAVPGTGCGEGVLLGGGRLLWSRRLDAGFDVATTLLDGSDARTLIPAQDLTKGALRPFVYYDGGRAAYLNDRCVGTEVILDSVAELEQGGPQPFEICRVSLATVPVRLRVDSRGRFRIRFSCPLGCEALAGLWIRAERRYVRLVDSYGNRTDRLNVSADRRGHVSQLFQLAGDDRRRLTHPRRLQVQLRFDVTQPQAADRHQARPLTLTSAG